MKKSFIQQLLSRGPMIIFLALLMAYLGFATLTETCPACQLANYVLGTDEKPEQTEVAQEIEFNLHDSGWVFETIDGVTIDTAQLSGKTVVVNYWATWCGPCLKEIPDFNRVSNTREDVQFIGISVDRSIDQPASFVEQGTIEYPVVHQDLRPAELIGTIHAIPTTLVFDPQGRLVKTKIGSLSIEALNKLIDQRPS